MSRRHATLTGLLLALAATPAPAAAQAGAPLLEEAGRDAIVAALTAQATAIEQMRAGARVIGSRSERWLQLSEDLRSGRRHALELLEQHGGVTVPPDATYHRGCDISETSAELAVAVFTLGPEWPQLVRHAHHELLEILHMPGRASIAVRDSVRSVLETHPARRATDAARAFYGDRGFRFQALQGGVGIGEGGFAHPRSDEDATRASIQFPGAGFMQAAPGCSDVPHATLLLVTRSDFPDAVWGTVTMPELPAAAQQLLAAVLAAWDDLQNPAALRDAEELERLGVAVNAERRARNAAWLARHRAELAPAIERYRRVLAESGGG